MMLAACTVVDETPETRASEAFPQPKPEFPTSERMKSNEGWVAVSHLVGRSGLVSDAWVSESSGNDAFEAAALDAVSTWRYPPGNEREESVLINFVFERQIVTLSRRFISLNEKIHTAIEDGNLDEAQQLLHELRANEELSPYEMAYSHLTEGRLAGAQGEPAGQLRHFRKAMLADGRWLARDNYLASLRAAIILE